MLNIFHYLDYRKYLKDYYTEKKRSSKSFSYQVFANLMGIKSKSLLHHIMDGKRNITEEAAFKVAQSLKFNKKSFSYFKDLIAFNQSKNLNERNFYFQRLSEYNKRSASRLLMQDKFEYLSKWYYSTIRELVGFFNFKHDFNLLAQALTPKVSTSQVRQAVNTLQKLELIRKMANGYEQTEKSVTTGDEVASIAVENFHHKNLELAAESINSCPGGERDISCLILSLSPDTFAEVKSEIKAFRKKLMEIADNSENPERVYHLSMNLFPTSSRIGNMSNVENR